MTIAFQLAVFALIAISFLLVIGVPVALASPDGWSSSKIRPFPLAYLNFPLCVFNSGLGFHRTEIRL